MEYGDNPWRPFCSERCKLIDFDKWTSDEYRVPGISVNVGETEQNGKGSETSVQDDDDDE